MKFHKLHVGGFRSFGEEQTFELPDGPGLWLLLGQNDAEPDLGANGAGKSTLWDALCWVLFGKTARGTKGPGLVNWTGASLCCVEVEFEIGSSYYQLRRTQTPNSLLLLDHDAGDQDGRPVEQKEVDDLLGCDWDCFVHSVLMGQFAKFFLDLTAGDKLRVFNNALKLRVWEDAAKLAGKWRKDTEGEIADLEKDEARLEGALEASLETLRRVKKSEGGWQGAQEKKLKQARKAVRVCKDGKAGAEYNKEKAAGRHRRAKGKYEDSLGELTKAMEEAQAEQLDLARAETRASHARASLADFPKGTCPECKQDIPEAHRKRVRARFRQAANRAAQDGQEARDRWKAAQETAREVGASTARLEALKKEALRQLQEASKDVVRWTEGLKGAEGELALLVELTNPYSAELAKIRRTRRKDKEALAEVREELKEKRTQAGHLSYWQDGFKDLRLLVVERALRELEAHINNGLMALGLNGWSVTFDVERPSASGSVVKGFATFITSPDSGEPVAWESWSGGETQRLRIAGEIGMSDLIRNRRGFACDLEVWDEPTAHLSEEGVDDLIRFFAQRTRNEGKQLWVVDHRAPDHGDFVGSFVVRKTKRGSVVEDGHSR